MMSTTTGKLPPLVCPSTSLGKVVPLGVSLFEDLWGRLPGFDGPSLNQLTTVSAVALSGVGTTLIPLFAQCLAERISTEPDCLHSVLPKLERNTLGAHFPQLCSTSRLQYLHSVSVSSALCLTHIQMCSGHISYARVEHCNFGEPQWRLSGFKAF